MQKQETRNKNTRKKKNNSIIYEIVIKSEKYCNCKKKKNKKKNKNSNPNPHSNPQQRVQWRQKEREEKLKIHHYVGSLLVKKKLGNRLHFISFHHFIFSLFFPMLYINSGLQMKKRKKIAKKNFFYFKKIHTHRRESSFSSSVKWDRGSRGVGRGVVNQQKTKKNHEWQK